MTPSTGPNLTAALWYATHGWHVFPLLPGSKRPAVPTHRGTDCDRSEPWCHDGHTGWEQRATTDPDRITRAWSSRPDLGVGIACGPSQLLVVDTDTAEPDAPRPPQWERRDITGETVLAELAAQHQAEIPATWTVETPSGGVHRYYRTDHLDQPGRLRNTAGRLGWLIDTRSAGGYVVAPPTNTDTGTYTVRRREALAELPDWLHELLTTRPRPRLDKPAAPIRTRDLTGYIRAAVARECAEVRDAIPGTRNNTLFCAAAALGQLVAGGTLPEQAAQAALLDAAAGHVAAGAYSQPQALATIRSGFTTGARTPRTAA